MNRESTMSLDIAAIRRQPGWLEPDACDRLRTAAALVPTEHAIVEIGGYRGRSTGHLALGSHEGNQAPIYTIDTWDTRPVTTWPKDHPGYIDKYADPDVRADYDNHLTAAGITHLVTPICGWSTDVAHNWTGPHIGLLFHDGSHYHDDVIADLQAWLPLMAEHATLILHDAGNPTCGVLTAAETVIPDHPNWDWAGRELAPWFHKGADTRRRGTLTVRTKA